MAFLLAHAPTQELLRSLRAAAQPADVSRHSSLLRVATGGPDQPVANCLLPSGHNQLLINAQLPSNQAEARSAEMIELRDHLEHTLGNLGLILDVRHSFAAAAGGSLGCSRPRLAWSR